MKDIAEDLKVGFVEKEGTKVLSIVLMTDVRTAQSINIVGDEVTELYEFLKSNIEEDQL